MENQLSQARAPIFEALRAFSKERVVPFDVPGHKHGKGNPELTEFLGQATMDADVNSMKPLDNLCHPVSVIHDAEVLAAQAFGAAHAFFMVSGTTGSVQAMILSVCKRGDKIIMPRNVHRSAINALVLCGAVPVYVNPGVDPQLGIALGMSLADVERAIEANPDAKAVLVNNPTYYGVCSDLRSIVKLAHAHGMRVLADEAHGTHFSFSDALPVSAMAAGADMAAVSMHKSGGSLTQSSMLLIGPAMSEGYVRAVINLTQTTSASYLLLASLDISRRNLALRGQETMARVAALAEYARAEINAIGDYDAFSKERINGTSFFDFDITKLSVHTLGLGLAAGHLCRDGAIGLFDAVIARPRADERKMLGNAADVRRDGHAVVVQNNDELLAALPGIVHGLIGQAAGHCAVPHQGHDVIVLMLQRAGTRHAEGGGD